MSKVNRSRKPMHPFNEHTLTNNVNTALKVIKTILDTSRSPQLPSATPHEYDDKYLLADFVSTCSIASQLHCLEVLGLTEAQLIQMKKWGKTRTVTLRYTNITTRQPCFLKIKFEF